MRRTPLKEWLKIGAIALVVMVLMTRVPVIIALAREEVVEQPPACQAGPDALRAALAAAPRGVRVEGTRLSACFVRASESAEVQQLSSDLLDVASGLSRDAVARPESRPALELGYLVGAVQRGTPGDQGIYETMEDRLEQEAVTVAASRAYRRGLQAGRRTG